VFARTGVDALNPKPPERPLFDAAIAIGVLQAFFDPLNGQTQIVF
jgi:hypothetical protein